jgi:acyl carrier protein
VEVDRPTNEIETVVSRIWTDVFGHDHIGIHQQFSQLGGHSLLAMQIVAKARSAYQIDLSLRDFFAAPSIAEFSARIEEKVILEIENLSETEAQRLVRTSKDGGAS